MTPHEHDTIEAGLRPTGIAGDLATRRADLSNPKWRSIRRSGPLRLGFNSIVAFGDGTPAEAYAKFIDLAIHAESLGYASAAIRVRHFQPNVSGHVALLAAASQHTTAIHLGTAVIPIAYEDVLRLAEELLTLDHLSSQRLEVGLSASAFDDKVKVRWSAREWDLSKEEQWDKIATLISYISGDGIPIDNTGSILSGGEESGLAYVSPAGPGLRDRLFYGAGSLASARRAGQLGLSLFNSTLNTEHAGLRLEPAQYEQIAAHRESFDLARPGSTPSVWASRYVIPTTGAWAERNLGLLSWYFDRFDPSGVPRSSDRPHIHQHPATGSSDEIAEILATDIALAAADGISVVVPSELPTPAARELLTIIAEYVAPRFEAAATNDAARS
ncbi:MAG TPA: LLM class flavin-dependent oxidoreductase [Solirubrobacteraceae bacterium]|jgi:alkanesulfonate monooxygenase SsuD/methylene tetrahydromethanopterin reductase-like flavin-dependent oxidoreductase (luciferase family)